MKRSLKRAKFLQLAEICGAHEPEFWFCQNFSDGNAMGICVNAGCDFTIRKMPIFSSKGFCERCKTETVVSGMVLYGIKDPYDTPFLRKLEAQWKKK